MQKSLSNNKYVLIVLLFLLIIACLTICTDHAYAYDSSTSGDWSYHNGSDGIVLDRYLGSASSVDVPSSINGQQVVEIGNNTFLYCYDVTKVTIPEGVKAIGGLAFSNTAISSIDLPNSLESIDSSAFASCSELRSVVIPENVTYMGHGAFYGCYSISSITMPACLLNGNALKDFFQHLDGVSYLKLTGEYPTIGDGAIHECFGLRTVVLPEGLTSIGEGAFYRCTHLTELNIPETVTSIGKEAFSNCVSLKKINIPEGVTAIGDNTFYNCKALESITLPEGVTGIGESAFNNCASLTELNIPGNVTSIGASAFEGCKALTGTVVIPESVTEVGENAFSGCSALTGAILPDGLTSIENGLFNGCEVLSDVTVPEGITKIGSEAFSGCKMLTAVNIPGVVEEIGDSAFKNCSELTAVNIPEGIKKIGRYTFYGCSNLSEASLPESITSIGEYAFGKCASLDSASLYEGLETIGREAFNGCKKIKTIVIPSSCKKIDKSAFLNCGSLKKIYFNSDTVDIGLYAFGYYKDSDGDYGYYNGVQIFGKKGSTAETYCKRYVFDFIALDDEGPASEPSEPTTPTEPSEPTTPTDDKSGSDTVPEVKPAVDPADQKAPDGTAMGKGASAEAANKAITSAKTDKDLKGSVFNKLKVKQSKVTKTSITISWSKVKNAKKYVVYAGKSGKNNKVRKITTLKGTKTKYTLKKFNKKKLTKGTYYKFAVVALDKNGKVITSSKFAHIATKGKNSKSNPVKVTVSNKVKNNKITLKAKKTFKLKGKYTSSAKKYTIKKILPVRYESTNPKVAKVDSKGVITAKKNGTCYIYVYAQNGLYKKIKVTVK